MVDRLDTLSKKCNKKYKVHKKVKHKIFKEIKFQLINSILIHLFLKE